MTCSTQTVNIGAVRYLNTRPLIYGLGDTAPWANVVLETPRCLAEQLESGHIDIGLVPSVEYPRLGGAIIPDISISSYGDVLSVLLISNKELNQVQRLGLDVSSLSSVALTRVLCREWFGIEPQFVDCPPDPSLLESHMDAQLLIGDPAMKVDSSPYPYVYDLGMEWEQMTGLPFVYAFWLARSTDVDERLVTVLTEAKREGLKHLDEIVEEESHRLGLAKPTCHRYLSEVIGYGLGEREAAGLNRFYELCFKHKLIPSWPGLEFLF